MDKISKMSQLNKVPKRPNKKGEFSNFEYVTGSKFKITPFYWVKIQISPFYRVIFFVNVARFARHSKIESCVQVMQSSKVALKTGF